MEANADGTYRIEWLTGLQELPTYRVVMDLDDGVMRQELVTPGRIVSDEEYRSGAYVAPVNDDRVALILGGKRTLMSLNDAARISAARERVANEKLDATRSSSWMPRILRSWLQQKL